MKFLFVSPTGESAPIASRVLSEGHNVLLTSTLSNMGGLVEHTLLDSNPAALVRQYSPDVLVVDSPLYCKNLESVSHLGHKTVFTSLWSDLLEKDPKYNRTVISTLNLPIYDGSEGYPLTVEGWFNGNSFIAAFLAVRHVHLFPGEVGPVVPCMGSVVYGKFTKGKLYTATIKQMEKPLRRVDYRGPVSIDIIINKDRFGTAKLCARPRLETTSTFLEGTKMSASEILFSVATGSPLSHLYIDDWMVGVTLSIPPWPYTGQNSVPVHLTGIDQFNDKHIWLVDVCKEGSIYKCFNNSGLLGMVTARGKTIREARRRVYRTVSNIQVPNLQYRIDIGKSAIDIFHDLIEWKWM